jgi:methylated-DNA-protein-cysteine methyltransferase-like protein
MYGMKKWFVKSDLVPESGETIIAVKSPEGARVLSRHRKHSQAPEERKPLRRANRRAPVHETGKTFFEQVYEIVAEIPCGKVVSYGQIAEMLGRPRAAREVGWAMSGCPDGLPWQRVVMKDGSVTGGVWSEMRKALLREEGVAFLEDGRVDMDRHRWEKDI